MDKVTEGAVFESRASARPPWGRHTLLAGGQGGEGSRTGPSSTSGAGGGGLLNRMKRDVGRTDNSA
ncbi:hypothetical protein E2562_025937 [Oryza meyeriana var. granulata]|uniref:Uncharacterized protein n=1 Tax=Oryza meyeriana var. granulata TaxID=110450 RepID=A0A6G1EYZ0_9ORYZ|nr:hypothetical protein E2562_025937 [Oryza meyeriana var. granulata]